MALSAIQLHNEFQFVSTIIPICTIKKMWKFFQIQSDFVFKLENIQNALWRSGVLKRHILIGCSVLLIHDGRRTDVRLIDFAKALYSENDNIGTEEGIANIIKILKSMLIQWGVCSTSCIASFVSFLLDSVKNRNLIMK